ncbi:MAG: hypothetical protein QOG21_1587 [Actinomycetota bacterium]|nr:hypothetical protein [Actinomycetota bacterium]
MWPAPVGLIPLKTLWVGESLNVRFRLIPSRLRSALPTIAASC